MLSTCIVHAIRTGTIFSDRSQSVYGAKPGRMLELPVYIAAVEGNGFKALIDTGLPEPSSLPAIIGLEQSPAEQIDRALAEIGWRTSEVDIVINTHMHYDHCGNNLLFPDAQFYVSRAEWHFAKHPSNAQAWTYDLEWTGPGLNYLNYSLVDADDYDVKPGLRIIQTPGHTPGHQSVLVNTAEGILCVTGDAANLLDNFAIPVHVANFVSPVDASTSLEKIRRLADRVFINHEPSIHNFQSAGFPFCPQPGTAKIDPDGAE